MFLETSVFPSANKYGIPDLLPDRLGTEPPKKIWLKKKGSCDDSLVLYGQGQFPEDCSGGVLGFYCHDEKFEAIWNDAVRTVQRLHHHKFKSVIMPDFSVWRESPWAVQLWNRYRSMWIARYWQEAGFQVIPSLTLADENCIDFCTAGVPKNAPLVAKQSVTIGKDNESRAYWVKAFNTVLDILKPRGLMIYGGERQREWLEPFLRTDAKVYWLWDLMTEMHGKRRVSLAKRRNK